jgi:Protein of unknown function (DUF2911)
MTVARFVPMIALVCALGAESLAQSVPVVKLPASPLGQSSVQLGGRWEKTPTGGPRYVDGKWLVVDYSRPLLRGRPDIFGSGASYGTFVNGDATIWRVGANDTTLLTTQTALRIATATVPPGVYNVFVDLKPGAWTFVLNTQPRQATYDPNEKVKLYGAYNYDRAFDVLRAPMSVTTSGPSVDQLTISFVNVSAAGATLSIAWDTTVATVPLAVAAPK